MALNVKQKYPGTQGGAAQLYASDTRLSLRRREQVFTRLSKSYKENMDISSTSSSSDEEIIVLIEWGKTPEKTPMPALQTLLGVYLLRRYVCVLGKTVLCLSAPKLRFTVSSAAPDTWAKSANLIGRIVFDVARQTKKTNPRRFFFF